MTVKQEKLAEIRHQNVFPPACRLITCFVALTHLAGVIAGEAIYYLQGHQVSRLAHLVHITKSSFLRAILHCCSRRAS
jgi:hypothetical protein